MPASPEFEKAAGEVKNLKTAPDQNTQLQLYSLFKVARGQEVPDPGKWSMNFEGKAKYAAYQKVKDAGTTPEQADKEYVELVEKLKKELGYNG